MQIIYTYKIYIYYNSMLEGRNQVPMLKKEIRKRQNKEVISNPLMMYKR